MITTGTPTHAHSPTPRPVLCQPFHVVPYASGSSYPPHPNVSLLERCRCCCFSPPRVVLLAVLPTSMGFRSSAPMCPAPTLMSLLALAFHPFGFRINGIAVRPYRPTPTFVRFSLPHTWLPSCGKSPALFRITGGVRFWLSVSTSLVNSMARL